MNLERWQRIEELYHSANALPVEERLTFLSRACAEDPSVGEEVQSLLNQGITAQGWLDLPAMGLFAKTIATIATLKPTSSERPTNAHRLIGKMVGHYHVLELLGAGGMGAVYRAHDKRLRRDVALKVLTMGCGHAEQRARILSEARAASGLNHPGIMTIYEIGEDGEQLFIVMELVQGKSLREVLCTGSVETHTLVRLATQISEALATAHKRSVIHGDIKPENIMVLANDRVKLLDFGLAQTTVEDTLTITQLPIDLHAAGTLAYMAPEKLAGGPGDSRSDLFSFGVVLYEMATGKRPFPGPSCAALVAQVMKSLPAPLPESEGAISRSLSQIIFKLLQREPSSRYQSAEEVRVELNDLSRRLEMGSILPAAVADKTAIAVLPFKLLTPNPEDEYLAVALADPVINRLSANSDLLVRPISAVTRYAKQPADLTLAARDLDVEVLVEGSIQKFGERLRVNVQVWSVRDGSSRLSVSYDAKVSEIFELQDRIADRLARELNPTAPLQTSGASAPKNSAAYELFLRALERMRRNNRWDMRIAIEMLENATVLDPHFADAWSGLAEACVLMGGIFEPGPKWIARAEKAVRKALTLDRNNVEAYVARGRLIWTPSKKFKHRAALRALEQALQRRPTHDQALCWRGCVLMHIGLQLQAKECLSTALAVCPDNAFTLTFLGTNELYAGHYDEAWDWHSRALSIDRASLWANLLSPAAPLYAGQLEKAAEAIRSAAQILPKDPLLASYEALLWAKRGERRKAEQLIRKAIVHGGRSLLHTHHTMHTVAAAYGVLGKPQPALAWLRKASNNGLPLYPVFRNESHFECMRSQPQFLRFIADLKKEWESYEREFGASVSERNEVDHRKRTAA